MRSSLCLILFIAFLAPAIRAQPAPPAGVEITTKTLSFQNGVAGYSGALETGIEKGKDRLDPKDIDLWVSRKYNSAAKTVEIEQQALFRFSGIFGDKPSQIPPGASVTKATLRLCVGSSDDAKSFHRIFLHRMLEPWDANAAWADSRWGGDGITADGKDAVATPDAVVIPHAKDTAYDIDVTESLRAWARGEPNHGWVLLTVRNQHVPAAFITSRLAGDASRRPMLTVTFDTDPSNEAPRAADLSATPGRAGSVTLSLTATDDDREPPTVTFHGRKRPQAGPDFEVILIPDTQNYTMIKSGGKPGMFTSQMDWIVKNRKQRGIAFALHLGDITDTGDVHESEWQIATKDGLYCLEDPAATGLPDGIPYLVAVGNHDQRYLGSNGKIQSHGPARLYNKYFGVEHFAGKGYYGGNYGGDNNNHYALFDGGAEKFIAISLEYNFAKRNPGVLKWAGDLLKKHAGRRGIVVTHAAIMPGIGGVFQDDGANAYEGLKDNPNLMLIVGGHTNGEGRRTDNHKGSIVHSLVNDLQQDEGGGNGWLVIMGFSPRENKIRVRLHSPYTGEWRADTYGSYELDYDFGTKTEPFEKIATVKPGPDGSASCRWENLAPGADYEWRAEISDGRKTTRTMSLPLHIAR